MTRAPRKSILSEAAIQRQIVDYAAACLVDARLVAIPNASRRGAGGRATNAVAGLTPGVPDLALIVRGGATYWIEVKSARGKLSEAQREFHRWMGINGVWAVTVRSLEDFKTVLRLWRVQTREAA